MADDILKNIWNELSSKGKTDSEFDAWKTNVYDNEDVQNNVYGYLKDNGYTDSEFGDWKANALPAKTNDSASADPAVGSENNTGSQSENGLSGSRDASDFENTQEKATAIERTFGKNEFTDFVGDIYRAWDAGTEAGSSVNEAFDVYKGKDSTDEELYAFLDKTRSIEEKGQTDEMLGASEKMAELKKEGYNGVSAFFGGWWDNPTAMLQYTVMSLSQMGRALVDSEEVAGTAAASSGAAALVGGGAGAALTAWSGPGALFGAAGGAIGGAVGGFFGGLSGAMETGMTTAALIQEEAIKDGLDWGNLSDKERFDYVRKLQNDTEKFNEIKSNALARGISIGAIDGVVGAISGGVGNAAFKGVAAGSKSALAGAAKVASVAALETTGGMLSEVAGQAAAGQEFNLEEILIEGFADKTFTGISLAQAATQGTPKYILNGQKLNGKQFSEALKIMSDKAYVSADIKIENSPAAQQLVNNRRQDIAADQKVDSRVSNIDDRSAAIKLTKEQNSLEGNPKGNKTRLDQIKAELNTISEKYADSDVDVTIEQRQQAVAAAVENKFESQFNKNVKAASDGGKKIGLKTTVYKTDLGYKKAIEKAFGKLPKGWDSSEGVFAGNGKLFINKAKAKRSIDIATGNNGAISVASHEVLHPIFNALIGGATTQGEFVQQFRTRMTGKQKTYVDSQLKKRGYDKSVTGIELMNIFSDGIVKNEINYDQTLFEKLGDSIVRLFKGEGFDKLSFDNGKDVYNFLKEYNTSIKEGKLSDKAISTIKEAEGEKKVKVADAKLLKEEQFSKTLTPEQSTELKTDIASIKEIAAENEALAKKYGKEPIKGRKQTKLEEKVLTGIKAVVDKLITSRTKALYDPIAEDAKRNVTRQEFKDSMRTDLEVMVLNEYDGSQELEKFIINRGYLRANNLAKRLGIESQEDGGIKSDVDAAKDIVSTKDTQSIDRSGNVERGQATFDQLDIVDDKLISEIESELSKELRMRAQKGTLSATVSVKKGRETYIESWIEDYVNKQLFKKLLKKVGAIGERNGKTVIPGAYIDFLNDQKTFDIVTKALPIKSIKKSYSKLFSVERIGRELTAEGNPVFRIGKINKKAFLTYFVDGKKTTILERQKQLFREILGPQIKQAVVNYATPENISKLKELQELAPAESLDALNEISIEAQLNNLEENVDRYKDDQAGFDVIQFSKSLINESLEVGGNNSGLLTIQFSKSSRKSYEDILKKKRPDLKNVTKEVDNLFKWVEGLDVPLNKKTKYEKLALFYMGNAYLVLPEDGYKVVDAIKVASAKKLDPFSFKNPNELLEKYSSKNKNTRINPDKVKTLSNKKQLPDGITIYDVEDTKEAQLEIRALLDSHWGEKFNNWCILARLDGGMDKAFTFWKHYGGGKRIAFKDGKLLSFWVNNSKFWWDRMDKPTDDLMFAVKTNDNSGLKQLMGMNTKTGVAKLLWLEKGSLESDFYAKYNAKKELVYKKSETPSSITYFSNPEKGGIISDWKKGNEGAKFELNLYKTTENSVIDLDVEDFEDIEEGTKVWKTSETIIQREPGTNQRISSVSKYTDGKDSYTIKYAGDVGEVISREFNGKKYLTAADLIFREDPFLDEKKINETYAKNMDGFQELMEIAVPLDSNNNPSIKNPELIPFINSEIEIIQFSKGIKEAFELEKDQVKFTDSKQIEEGRDGLIKLFKKLKKEGFNSGDVANMIIGTARGSWNLGGGKYVIGAENKLVERKNLKNGKFRYQRFLMTGGNDFFKLLKKAYPKVTYQKGKGYFMDGKIQYDLDKVPSQGTKGFADGSMFNGKNSANATLNQRNEYSIKQRKNLKILVNTLSYMYDNKGLSANQAAMILATLGSSTNGLIRTAAKLIGYSDQGLTKKQKLDYENFRFEHAQTASATIVELSKLITDKNYPHSFDQIMEGFNVYIIPKTYDNVISGVYNSTIPLDASGYMILSTELNPVRYTDKNTKAAIKKAKLAPLKLESFSLQFSKTLNNDFNNIIEGATKGSKSRINTNTVPVYHGGEVNSIKDINGFIYFSDDKAQAQEYAKGNYGDVKNFTLKESNIVPEADVFKVIRELDIQPKEKGWTVDDSRLYELIDDRFEQSFTKGDMKKLKAGLKKKGIKASRFTDSDMKTGKDIENIVVFDKSIIQFSKTVDQDFNNIIEGATGIESFKRFSEAKGKVRGRGKGKYKFFIPPSADDFAGLIGRLLGKGKEGDINAAWFKENLFNPFAKGIRDFEAYKEQTTHMVKALKKRIKNVPNGLNKINETGFTNEAAVRVYLWAKNGYDISGLSATDQKDLIEIIENNKALKDFANELDQTFNGYPEPNNDWLAGTVTTDIINMVNTTKRAEFLESWQENSDIIFSKENINKLRAAYGDNYVEALQDMLYRMKTGRNRPSGANKLTNRFMNWVNDSVGTIMFFNTRSALLQTLSIANFINWGDNNPAKAAMAFANQKQFWADFAMLFNSNFLKQRRSGLKNDVNADDIANAAESATNKSKAVLASLLKLGFLPTQMADSFAIAMGGASFIRNRINKYVSEGMDTKAAEEQAFLDFQEVAEETQQSSRPDRISQQQASPLGRIILAFANTPMQYMRLTKKAFLDLKNGRGDVKTNISKIVYYTFIQNIIFSSLQAALFAAMFEDEEEEVVDNREIRIANSMLDSILRGAGIYGAIASTGKNIIMEIDKQSKKGRPDFTQAAIRSLDLSPPLSSKLRKLMSAGRAFSYSNVRDKMTGYGLDNPAFYAGGQIVSAFTNIPLDRAIKKADNLRVAVDNDTKLWQSIALGLGYSQWDLGLVETTANKKKSKWGDTAKWKKAGNWKKDWKSKNK